MDTQQSRPAVPGMANARAGTPPWGADPVPVSQGRCSGCHGAPACKPYSLKGAERHSPGPSHLWPQIQRTAYNCPESAMCERGRWVIGPLSGFRVRFPSFCDSESSRFPLSLERSSRRHKWPSWGRAHVVLRAPGPHLGGWARLGRVGLGTSTTPGASDNPPSWGPSDLGARPALR